MARLVASRTLRSALRPSWSAALAIKRPESGRSFRMTADVGYAPIADAVPFAWGGLVRASPTIDRPKQCCGVASLLPTKLIPVNIPLKATA
jgi:hypothetical protein